MELYIPASSPLFSYTCAQCVPERATDGSLGSTSRTLRSNSTIGLDFTGSSISFDFNVPPNTIDSTGVSSVSSSSPASVSGLVTSSGVIPRIYINATEHFTLPITQLPLGVHSTIVHLDSVGERSMVFGGARVGVGAMEGEGSVLVSVDDTAWRDGRVKLTPGWNMLEKGASNWINTTQFDSESLTADNNYNSSTSWTDVAGAATSIAFTGSTFLVYGTTGPQGGEYEVTLDDQVLGAYSAQAPSKLYGSVLFYRSGLGDVPHNVTLRNTVQGGRLYFDRLESWSGLLAIPSTNPVSAPTPKPTPLSASSQASGPAASGISRGAIAGIATAGALVLLAIVASLAFCLWRKKAKKAIVEKPESIKPQTTFWRWSTSTGHTGALSSRLSLSPERSRTHPFFPLPGNESKKGDTAKALPYSFVPKLGTTTYRLDSGGSTATLDQLAFKAHHPPPPTSGIDFDAVPHSGGERGRSRSVTPIQNPPKGTKPQHSFLRLSKSPHKLRSKSKSRSQLFLLNNRVDSPNTFGSLDSPTATGPEQHHHQGLPREMTEGDTVDDLPSRSGALGAALKGASSPLTSLRDSYADKHSYFPSLGTNPSPAPANNASARFFGRRRNVGSMSIKTAREDDRPMTPGGILDGYLDPLPQPGATIAASGLSVGAGGAAQGAGDHGESKGGWMEGRDILPSLSDKDQKRRFF